MLMGRTDISVCSYYEIDSSHRGNRAHGEKIKRDSLIITILQESLSLPALQALDFRGEEKITN
jgi:hypothetical protein